MNKEYFTPEIEDFHVGYEYEYEDIIPSGASDYFKGVICKPCEIESLFQGFEVGLGIRVPYLTGEQIESEGWTLDKNLYKLKKHEDLVFTVDFDIESYFLKIDSYDKTRTTFYSGKCIFEGECKDINTFRKIQKLLKI